jgi:hypothetical protein
VIVQLTILVRQMDGLSLTDTDGARAERGAEEPVALIRLACTFERDAIYALRYQAFHKHY